MQQGEDDRIDRIVGKIGEFNASVQAPMLDLLGGLSGRQSG